MVIARAAKRRRIMGKSRKSKRKFMRKRLRWMSKVAKAPAIPRSPFTGVLTNVVPMHLKTRMVYQNMEAYAAGSAGTMNVLSTFRANSIWDPFYPLGGTTVADHTRLASLYNKYRVISSKITYTVIRKSDIGGHVFLTKVDDDATGFSGSDVYYRWYMDPRVKMKAFNQTPATSQVNFTFSRVYHARKWMPGGTDVYTAMSSNPTDGVFFCAAMQTCDPADATVAFTLWVRIIYYVEFSDPKDQFNKF